MITVKKYQLTILLLLIAFLFASFDQIEFCTPEVSNHDSKDIVENPSFATQAMEISGALEYVTTISLDQRIDCFTIDPKNGHIYAYHPTLYCVKAYDSDFNLLGTIGTEGEQGSDNDHFGIYQTTTPFGGIAVSSNGRLFISDPQNQRVQVFNINDLTYHSTINCSSFAEVPFGLDIRNDGSLYIGMYNGPVLLFDKNLSYLKSISTTGNMHTVAIDSKGRIYTGHGDTSNNEVPVFSSDNGSFLYGIESADGTAFTRPVIVRTDYRDNLYIVCDFQNRIQIFDKSHNFVGTIGVPDVSGDDQDHLDLPLDVAYYRGHVYVLDHDNNRIQIFSMFQPHTAIVINGDSVFDQQAINEKWLGNGSVSDPYIIEGYSFSDSVTLIEIRNTNVHFQIRGNWLNGINKVFDGIYLNDVLHGTLSNNMIFNCSSGITLDNSKDNNLLNNDIVGSNTGIVHTSASENTIDGNLVHESIQTGMFIFDTKHTTISNNEVFDNNNAGLHLLSSDNNDIISNSFYDNIDSGIYLESAKHNTISNNHIHDIQNQGFLVEDSNYNLIEKNKIESCGLGLFMDHSYENTIKGNNVTDSSCSGIDIHSCMQNEYTNNSAIHNQDNGFLLWNCSYLLISNNTIAYNARGIHLHAVNNEFNEIFGNTIVANTQQAIILDDSSQYNNIKGNDIINNGGDPSQAIDDGIDNEFSDNYWSEWTSPDADGDGFVDNPYAIDGSANNHDYFPLVHSISSTMTITPAKTTQATIELTRFDALSLFIGFVLLLYFRKNRFFQKIKK